MICEQANAGVNTSDATATAEDILEGKTAYVDGVKLTGLLEQGYKISVSTLQAYQAGGAYTITSHSVDFTPEGCLITAAYDGYNGLSVTGALVGCTYLNGSSRKTVVVDSSSVRGGSATIGTSSITIRSDSSKWNSNINIYYVSIVWGK